MRVKPISVGATTVLSLGLLVGAAQAAPLGGGPASAEANTTSSAVQKVDDRRCWFVDGVRHCRWYPEPYRYGYYDDDDDYGPGYGYGPGIGFSFGGGGGHFRGGGFHGGVGGHGHR
ncbi:MAG: hypothetical protein J2P50_06790 [Hyphomicrobiaceae bacterium]|nr:hypothetical protein [Hyphomicrobiaceae bacterium]